jgi:hypothetical protein
MPLVYFSLHFFHVLARTGILDCALWRIALCRFWRLNLVLDRLPVLYQIVLVVSKQLYDVLSFVYETRIVLMILRDELLDHYQ